MDRVVIRVQATYRGYDGAVDGDYHAICLPRQHIVAYCELMSAPEHLAITVIGEEAAYIVRGQIAEMDKLMTSRMDVGIFDLT